jgi:PKD repeat protein
LNLGLTGGVLSFIPAKQKVTSTKSFQLIYGKDTNEIAADINIVVPNASFKIKLQAGRGALGGLTGFNNSTAIFTSNVKKAISYEWNLTVNGVKITTENTQEISTVFKEPRTASINLTITISVDGVNSTRTSDTIDLLNLDAATMKSLNAGNEIDTGKLK